jgi:hypothetical protein
VFPRLFHFTRRVIWLAAILLPLAASGGCMLWNWNKADWNLERYRDSRATDIDHRLEKATPIIQNPF